MESTKPMEPNDSTYKYGGEKKKINQTQVSYGIVDTLDEKFNEGWIHWIHYLLMLTNSNDFGHDLSG